MINFCTLFDSNYLARGLALYDSLSRTSPGFHLYVIAFDENCYRFLKNAGHANLTPVRLKDFEDPALLSVKETRSIAEYCWTCTPSVILYCLKKFDLPSCTYVDADMIFYRNPQVLFDELREDESVIISEHRYTSDYEQSQISGRYCVQFMYFRNDPQGLQALTWWRERCLEWCYARVEDGKFGDQKYLDDWTQRFSGVHVMQHPGGGLAPWNVQQYQVSSDLMLTEKATGRQSPLIFYHFHGLKFFTDGWVSCCGPVYDISQEVKEHLYLPYVRVLLQKEKEISQAGWKLNVNGARSESPSTAWIYKEYIKDRLVLWKIGNIPVHKLKLGALASHDHYFKTQSLIPAWPKS